MTAHDWRVRIDDIIEAVEKIDRYLAGLTFESFVSDERTVDAVLRNFEIVGEAARHVPAEVQARFPAIPWPRMRAMRNIVIHAYRQVNLGIVWDTARDDLPQLLPLLRQIIEREP
jgi:uncharacterized protein with HEPN domain